MQTRFIRSIAMEGGMGPVAGSSHHSLYQRMPGTKILSPMTPNEYQFAYDDFIVNDDVYYISEHRLSYDNEKERTVLIFDMLRPLDTTIPLGTAKKGHTDQLDDFIAWFQ